MSSAAELISLLDLTHLQLPVSDEEIAAFCRQAITPLGPVAAVCVYPQFVPIARDILANTPVKIATVVNFPSGTESDDDIMATTANALKDGATEIDLVIPYHCYLENFPSQTTELVADVKALCGEDVLLKTILETGALVKPSVIQRAARDAIKGGSDFLKTSTGKNYPGADSAAVATLLQIIAENPERKIGIKISGGVRTWEQAQEYLNQISSVLGAHWISPAHVRFGASGLLQEILNNAAALH